MAANHFDELTRAFASSTSRRQALKSFVVGAGGLLGLGSLGTALAAEADPKQGMCLSKGRTCIQTLNQCCSGLSCSGYDKQKHQHYCA
ncbi:MAG TPA: hypothetical protein VFV38_02375 [Ktedonobacteraceae bacterium]|nr:hypothetical protein [Ktedonobacteraceae bacterium]